MEVPNGFKRDCFLVTLATESGSLKNANVYEDNPTFQIVYFGKRNEANQVLGEQLYKLKEELKALFLLRMCVPVLPLEGVKERPRYAKIESYSSEVRLNEGAVYTKLTLNFTEAIPKVDNHEMMLEVELVTKTNG
jgi:hypothetical protein